MPLLGGLLLEYTVVKEYTASRAFEVRKLEFPLYHLSAV